MRTPRLLTRPYYPNFDGLRGLSFLLVFCCHYVDAVSSSPWWQRGWVGVDIFFVLSGFLITGILLDTQTQPAPLRGFYVRRALRILPLFYGVWAAIILLTPLLRIHWNLYDLADMAFIGDFFYPSEILLNHGPVTYLLAHFGQHAEPIVIAHFWTLYTEEQFYALWPLVVLLVRRPRRLLVISFAIVLGEPALRAWTVHAYPQWALLAGGNYGSSFTRIDTLMMGAILAIWLRNRSTTFGQLRTAQWLLLTLPLLGLVVLRTRFADNPGWLYDRAFSVWGLSCVGLLSAGLVLLAQRAADTHPVSRVLMWGPLARIGRLSYGLYVLHMLPLEMFRHRAGHLRGRPVASALAVLLMFALVYAAAWLSFRFLESPFLRLKSRWAPRPGVSDPKPMPMPHAA